MAAPMATQDGAGEDSAQAAKLRAVLLQDDDAADLGLGVSPVAASVRVAEQDASLCVECQEPGVIFCIDCADRFCAVCFQTQHRRGRRVRHKYQSLFLGPEAGLC